MVTRDEEHSTRGRANLLRAALSGKLPPEEFTGQRMFEAMDLCIECKACKSECPSSVDMAKIKFEFLAHYYEVNDVPLRTRLFGNIHHLSRLSSGPLAPVANWSLKNPILRQAMDKLIGISAERDLPKFAAQPFAVWFKRRPARSNLAPRGKVVLFADTFNNYNTPEVAIAATQVLEAAGYEVILSNHGCCGRPMISKGLVNEARALAEKTVARLASLAEQGLPIIGLEPSCILSLQDEYFSLLPDNPAVKLVAEQTITFEEFIAQQMDDPSFELPLKPGRREVLLHGHCHQKALVGTDPAKKMLGLLGEVTEVDSGCCGMAGSFGYEAEHYEVSIAMAERRLLPAVRRADSTTLVVAAGVSCRHQIDHGSEREALHPAQALQACLAER
jgi:Fe-S oxidoreductase